MTAARKHLASKPVSYDSFASAKDELNKCWTNIDLAIEQGGWWYKSICVYAADIVLFLLLMVVGAALLPFYYSRPIMFGLFPVWVASAGAMGSSLRFLWDLKYRIDRREYCKNWKSGALITPFIGGIIALGVYPAYFIASRATGIVLDMPGFSICILAGYGWMESIELLARLTRATLGSVLSKI